jgi:hypothetical protein
MATAGEQRSREAWLAAWAAAALPWLSSATLHVGTLVVLAVGWTSLRGVAPTAAPSEGISLLATVAVSRGDDSSDAELDASSGGYYTDDAPVMDAAADRTPRGAVGSAGWDLEPAVDLQGMLPRPGSGGVGLERNVGSATAQAASSSAPRTVRGGAARTGVFGLEGEGYKFVYVFDRSGSMDGHGGAPLAAAKAELLSSLGDLGATHQFQIIFYNEEPAIFSPGGTPGRLLFGTDQNKRQADRFVRGIMADGGTRHEDALLLALRMSPDVVFFLTDADEPRMSAGQLARIARANRGSTVHAIEFGFGPQVDRDNFLVRLAEQNLGRHIYVDISRLGTR